MARLVIAGQVATMADDPPEPPARGRVWIDGDAVVGVTSGEDRPAGFDGAAEVDVGASFVLPGFTDMHNHLAYNALPLWAEPGRTKPWLHNKNWPDADTYTESITEPAWTYAKACPEALLAYVQVREMAGGATSAQGWPSSNRGYQTVVRNVDAERAGRPGAEGDNLIYTSVVTKTGDSLVTAVRRMEAGSGFIYHCSEGQKGSRVRSDYVDLERADGLLPTLIGIHCCALGADDWLKWEPADAGGVVWSPLSNLVLYQDTTLIDDARARGLLVCLGSDWGPSGTRNLLGEMKAARIAAAASPHFSGSSLASSSSSAALRRTLPDRNRCAGTRSPVRWSVNTSPLVSEVASSRVTPSRPAMRSMSTRPSCSRLIATASAGDSAFAGSSRKPTIRWVKNFAFVAVLVNSS